MILIKTKFVPNYYPLATLSGMNIIQVIEYIYFISLQEIIHPPRKKIKVNMVKNVKNSSISLTFVELRNSSSFLRFSPFNLIFF